MEGTGEWRSALSRVWHQTFGEVKCWSRATCPVCRDTDWPVASWIKNPATPTPTYRQGVSNSRSHP